MAFTSADLGDSPAADWPAGTPFALSPAAPAGPPMTSRLVSNESKSFILVYSFIKPGCGERPEDWIPEVLRASRGPGHVHASNPGRPRYRSDASGGNPLV